MARYYLIKAPRLIGRHLLSSRDGPRGQAAGSRTKGALILLTGETRISLPFERIILRIDTSAYILPNQVPTSRPPSTRATIRDTATSFESYGGFQTTTLPQATSGVDRTSRQPAFSHHGTRVCREWTADPSGRGYSGARYWNRSSQHRASASFPALFYWPRLASAQVVVVTEHMRADMANMVPALCLLLHSHFSSL